MTSGWAEAEFNGAALVDERYRRNLVSCVESLAVRSEASFSGAVGHAGRQAMRRLLQREDQSLEGLLAGHVAETARRAAAWDLLLVAQDMTPLDYSSQASRTELGPFNGGERERYLLLHSQLAVSPTGLPLGLLGLELWTRDRATVGKRKRRKQRPVAEKESARWRRSVERVEAALPATQRVLVIGDAEGDVYDHPGMPRRALTDLLVRAAQNRVVWVGDERQLLFEAAGRALVVGRMTVTVPRQAGVPERTAELTVREVELRLAPPRSKRPMGVPYRVIRAAEENPPEGLEEPICWVLLTTLPTSGAGGVAARGVLHAALDDRAVARYLEVGAAGGAAANRGLRALAEGGGAAGGGRLAGAVPDAAGPGGAGPAGGGGAVARSAGGLAGGAAETGGDGLAGGL